MDIEKVEKMVYVLESLGSEKLKFVDNELSDKDSLYQLDKLNSLYSKVLLNIEKLL